MATKALDRCASNRSLSDETSKLCWKALVASSEVGNLANLNAEAMPSSYASAENFS